MWNKIDNKKVIFFDNGNTLLSFHNKKDDKKREELGEQYLFAYLNEKFPEVTFESLKEGFLNPWYSLLEKRSSEKKEYEIDELLNGYLSKYNAYLPYPELVKAMRLYYRPFLEAIEIEKHLYDTLKTLKDNGYKLGIIANTPYYKEIIMECLEEVGIDHLFDEVILSYDTKLVKPNIDIFEYAMRLFHVEASECVMVGDSLYKDMEPASRLGMKCYWLNKKNDDNYLNVTNMMEIDKLSDLIHELLIEDEGNQETYVEYEEVLPDEEDDDFNVEDYIEEEEDEY